MDCPWFKSMGSFLGIGSFLGGATGFAVAGPVGIVPGAKIGGSLGVQVAILNKGEQALDRVGEKVETSVDKAAEKVGNAFDTTGKKVGEAVDEAGQKVGTFLDTVNKVTDQLGSATVRAIVDITDVYSKLMLAGYSFQMLQSSSAEYLRLHQEFCAEAFESLNCASLTMTQISLNACAMVVGIVLAIRIGKMLLQVGSNTAQQMNVSESNLVKV